jgi:hypothetical protein
MSSTRSQNVVKSAPNLDKRPNSASTSRGSRSDVLLGKSEDGLDKILLENDNCNINNSNHHLYHNNSNSNSHINQKFNKHNNSSLQTDEDDTEHDFDGDDYDSDEIAQNNCFGVFIKKDSAYRNMGKSKKTRHSRSKNSSINTEDFSQNSQVRILEIPFRVPSKSKNLPKERKIQFAEEADQNSILYDRNFYRKMQKSLDEIPSYVGHEEEFDSGKNGRKFMKISKSNDELSLCGDDEDFSGNPYWSSQFKREYFFTNINQNHGFQDDVEADAENSDSS